MKVLHGLHERHPDWVTPLYFLVGHGAHARFDDLVAAIAKDAPPDPLLEDLALRVGASRARAYVAVLAWKRAVEADLPADRAVPLLSAVADACDPGFEARLLRAWRDHLHARDGGLAAVGRVLEEMPVPLPADPATVWACGIATRAYAGAMRARVGPGDGSAVAYRFLRASDVDDLPWGAWETVAAERAEAASLLARAIATDDDAVARWESLRSDLQNGRARIGEAFAVVDGHVASALRRFPDLTPFVAALVAEQAKAHAPWDGFAVAANAWGDRRGEPERSAVQDEVSRWYDERRARETPEASEYDRRVALARRPADLHLLGLLSGVLGAAERVSESSDASAALRFATIRARLEAHLRGLSLRRPRRDWSAWGAPTPAPAAPTATESRTSPWPFAVAAAVLVIACIGAAATLARRRARRQGRE
jgi:hypothetical protein